MLFFLFNYFRAILERKVYFKNRFGAAKFEPWISRLLATLSTNLEEEITIVTH